MPRKGKVEKREILPDPKYNDLLVAKFINKIMKSGKKSIAEKICYGAFEILHKKLNDDPVKIFKKAVENAKPLIEVKSRRVGGATYQVPTEVPPERRVSLALTWIISFARARSEKTMVEKLAAEILDAYNNKGSTIKKRDDTHKMAEANKAFAHFKW